MPVSADFTVRQFFATLAPGSKLSPPVLFAADRSTRNEISPRPWRPCERASPMPIYTLPRYAVLGRRFALRAMLPPADTPRLAFAGSFGSGVFIHRSEVGC